MTFFNPMYPVRLTPAVGDTVQLTGLNVPTMGQVSWNGSVYSPITGEIIGHCGPGNSLTNGQNLTPFATMDKWR